MKIKRINGLLRQFITSTCLRNCLTISLRITLLLTALCNITNERLIRRRTLTRNTSIRLQTRNARSIKIVRVSLIKLLRLNCQLIINVRRIRRLNALRTQRMTRRNNLIRLRMKQRLNSIRLMKSIINGMRRRNLRLTNVYKICATRLHRLLIGSRTSSVLCTTMMLRLLTVMRKMMTRTRVLLRRKLKVTCATRLITSTINVNRRLLRNVNKRVSILMRARVLTRQRPKRNMTRRTTQRINVNVRCLCRQQTNRHRLRIKPRIGGLLRLLTPYKMLICFIRRRVLTTRNIRALDGIR